MTTAQILHPTPAAILPTPEELLGDLKEALNMFGKYTFTDKGPSEVMDIGKFADRFRCHPAEDAARVLRSFSHSGPDDTFRSGFSMIAAAEIVIELQSWDALFLEAGMDGLCSHEMPELLAGDVVAKVDSNAKAALKPRGMRR